MISVTQALVGEPGIYCLHMHQFKMCSGVMVLSLIGDKATNLWLGRQTLLLLSTSSVEMLQLPTRSVSRKRYVIASR